MLQQYRVPYSRYSWVYSGAPDFRRTTVSRKSPQYGAPASHTPLKHEQQKQKLIFFVGAIFASITTAAMSMNKNNNIIINNNIKTPYPPDPPA
jgi:hypothetical protein